MKVTIHKQLLLKTAHYSDMNMEYYIIVEWYSTLVSLADSILLQTLAQLGTCNGLLT